MAKLTTEQLETINRGIDKGHAPETVADLIGLDVALVASLYPEGKTHQQHIDEALPAAGMVPRKSTNSHTASTHQVTEVGRSKIQVNVSPEGQHRAVVMTSAESHRADIMEGRVDDDGKVKLFNPDAKLSLSERRQKLMRPYTRPVAGYEHEE